MTETASETSEPQSKRPRLSDEEHKLLVQKLKARKKLLSKIPQVVLAEIGQAASLEQPKESRVPIFVREVQSLITYSVVGDESRNFPFNVFKITKWNHLSNLIVVAVENVGVDDYENNTDCFQKTQKIFQHKLEVCNPTMGGKNLAVSLAFIPLTIGHIYASAQACKTLHDAIKIGYIHNINSLLEDDGDSKESKTDTSLEINKAIVLKKLQYESAKCNSHKQASRSVRKGQLTSSGEKLEENASQSAKEDVETTECMNRAALLNFGEASTPCSRLDLLLNKEQMAQEQIPIPGSPEYKGFVMTSPEYQPVTEVSPMFSLDCEWVLCRGGIKALARIAVVNERMECVYHTFVKPLLPVSDYLTKFSGVTGKMLNQVETTLTDVQQELQKLLPPDAIIVGQAVGSDLVALELFHPYIIDTSVIYNLSGIRAKKTKLSILAQVFLQKKIQTAIDGHSPIEDAAAAMELVLLKLKMGKDFGDVVLNETRNRFLPQGDDLFHIKLAQLDELFQNTNYKMTAEEEKIYDPNCSLHQKLFTFLESHNISSQLIAGSQFVDFYKPTLFLSSQAYLKGKKRYCPPVEPVKIVPAETLKAAVKEAAAHANQEKVSFVHTQVPDSDSPNGRRKKLAKLDKALGKLFLKTVSVNGMMIVIFSGVRDPFQNGLCFIAINKEVVDLSELTTLNQPNNLSSSK